MAAKVKPIGCLILLGLSTACFFLCCGGFGSILTDLSRQDTREANREGDSDRNTHWESEEAKQADRQVLINKLLAQGIFQKVEYEEDLGATVWVGPTFYLLSYDDKATFCSVVHAYSATREKAEHVTVELKDILSGKTVGEFSIFGLKMK